MTPSENRRILVIDDNLSIHDDFRKILESAGDEESTLREKEALLFGQTSPTVAAVEGFEVVTAAQGQEGLERIVTARREGRPFALVFVDLRMPPGWDGVETIERILPADPDVQLVICSAYSDYSAREILTRLGISDRLLMLRKPCDSAEILLLATSLCRKWNLAHVAESAACVPGTSCGGCDEPTSSNTTA